MRKIFLFLFGMLLSLFSSKADNLDNFFAKYKSHNKTEYIHISSELLNLTSSLSSLATTFNTEIPTDDKAFMSLLNDIKDIQFVIAKDSEVNLSEELKNNFFSDKKNYKLLTEVHRTPQYTEIYAEKSSDNFIRNFLVIITDSEDKTTAISKIEGVITKEKITQLISKK